MGNNLISNTNMAENFDRKIELEKLTPIGREILQTHKMVRIDPKTVILVKKDNSDLEKMEKVSKNENKIQKKMK